MHRWTSLALGSLLVAVPGWAATPEVHAERAENEPESRTYEDEGWRAETRLRSIADLQRMSRERAGRTPARETSARIVTAPIQQANYQQADDRANITAPALPPSAAGGPAFVSPPAGEAYPGAGGTYPAPGSGTIAPPATQPSTPAPAMGWSGTQPTAGGFATVGNSPCVTAPVLQTQYSAAGPYDCGTGTPVGLAPAPATFVPPMVAPPVVAGSAGYRPLFTLGQQNYNVQLGQGIIGQPVAYVPGQPVRNFLRYVFP